MEHEFQKVGAAGGQRQPLISAASFRGVGGIACNNVPGSYRRRPDQQKGATIIENGGPSLLTHLTLTHI
jgi:hypothetical protein